MIKIMDRSIWYYIKRPSFAVSLFYSSPSFRTYSLFVMDLIEADMLEFDPAGFSSWKIKETKSWINESLTNSYIDSILRQKHKQLSSVIQKRKVEEEISKHLNALKGENTQHG